MPTGVGAAMEVTDEEMDIASAMAMSSPKPRAIYMYSTVLSSPAVPSTHTPTRATIGMCNRILQNPSILL